MRTTRLAALAAALAAASVMLASCSRVLGYGVALWDIAPETPAAADGSPAVEPAATAVVPSGAVMEVLIRQNLTRKYVVSAPTAADPGRRLECPLWRVELFPTLEEAVAFAKGFSEFAPLYAVNDKDGLPFREDPANGARSVYRLRAGEKVKVVGRAKGEAVTVGSGALEGEWLKVLAEDGTRGYCFSRYLAVYDARKGTGATAATAATSTIKVEALIAKPWRPKYFLEMLGKGAYDLDSFNPRYGMFVDPIHKQLRIELPDLSKIYTYSGIAASGADTVAFGATPIVWKLGPGGSLTVEVVDDAEKPVSLEFAQVQQDIQGIVEAERKRRDGLILGFLQAGSTYSHPDFGTFTVFADGGFSWIGAAAFTPLAALMPAGDADAEGKVDVRLELSPELAASGAGTISFRPRSSAAWADFIYRFAQDGLELEQVPETAVVDGVVAQAGGGYQYLFSRRAD